MTRTTVKSTKSGQSSKNVYPEVILCLKFYVKNIKKLIDSNKYRKL